MALLILALAVVVNVLPTTPAAGPVVEKSGEVSVEVEDILDRHLKAVGGAKRMAALKTIRATGRYSDEILREMPFVYTHLLDGRFRFDGGMMLTVADQHGCFTQSKGRGRPRQPMPAAHCARAIRSADLSATLLLSYARSQLRFLGEGQAGDRPLLKLVVDFEHSESGTYYLDAKTYLLNSVEETWQMGGQELLIMRSYEDYREVDGYTVPHRIRESNQEGWRDFLLEKIEINPSVDPADFKTQGAAEQSVEAPPG